MKPEQDDIGMIEHEVAILIRRAMAFSALYKRLGAVDRPSYLLLRQISESGPIGLKALADDFHLDRSTISRQATQLEAKGLIERVPDRIDGRIRLFRITEVGLRRLKETRQIRHKRYEALLCDWEPEDLEKFGEFLHSFNRTFID